MAQLNNVSLPTPNTKMPLMIEWNPPPPKDLWVPLTFWFSVDHNIPLWPIIVRRNDGIQYIYRDHIEFDPYEQINLRPLEEMIFSQLEPFEASLAEE